MNSFSLLSEQAEGGSIDIVNIVAVPRSVSTALGRAMNEAEPDSIFVNEPFNRNNLDLDIAAQQILDQVEHQARKRDSPITVVTKNMATYLRSSEFTELEIISKCTIWSVRDPKIQIGSLVTRMANDIVVETGAGILGQESIEPYLEEVTRALIDSEISKDFSRTGWQSIGEHFSRKDSDKNHVVIDGGKLVVEPAQILSSACKRVGLEYNPSMVSGWTSPYKNMNTGTSRFNTRENAWTTHAANSSGIVQSSRPSLDFAGLPKALRDHIDNVAVPIYTAMTADRT